MQRLESRQNSQSSRSRRGKTKSCKARATNQRSPLSSRARHRAVTIAGAENNCILRADGRWAGDQVRKQAPLPKCQHRQLRLFLASPSLKLKLHNKETKQCPGIRRSSAMRSRRPASSMNKQSHPFGQRTPGDLCPWCADCAGLKLRLIVCEDFTKSRIGI